MEIELKKLKHSIDRESKFLIVGYIRNNFEKLLKKNIEDELINWTVISFYYIAEYFKFYNPDKIESDDGNQSLRITAKKGKRGAIYGALVLPFKSNCIHQWTFKINKCGYYICIGIEEFSANHTTDDFLGEEHTKCYSTSSVRGSSFSHNDIILMELNLNKKILIFRKNNQIKYRSKAIQKPSTNAFKMYVYLSGNGNDGVSSVSLLSYSYIGNKGIKKLKQKRRKTQFQQEVLKKKQLNHPVQHHNDICKAMQGLQLNTKKKGICKRFNCERGYGFISVDDGSGDVFVHQTEIYANGYRSLEKGESVEFDISVQYDGRRKAINVTGPNGSFVKGVQHRFHGGGYRRGGINNN